jgi:Zn-dependent M28 family amino/carboxypeptidase
MLLSLWLFENVLRFPQLVLVSFTYKKDVLPLIHVSTTRVMRYVLESDMLLLAK